MPAKGKGQQARVTLGSIFFFVHMIPMLDLHRKLYLNAFLLTNGLAQGL